MERNSSEKNITFMNNPVCNTGSFLYLYLTKDEKFYLTLCAESQGILALIINILALVSVKQTKQWQLSSLKTTMLSSVHHFIWKSNAVNFYVLIYRGLQNINLSTIHLHIFVRGKYRVNMFCQF